MIDGGNVFVAVEVQVNTSTFFFELASIVYWTKSINPPDSCGQ